MASRVQIQDAALLSKRAAPLSTEGLVTSPDIKWDAGARPRSRGTQKEAAAREEPPLSPQPWTARAGDASLVAPVPPDTVSATQASDDMGVSGGSAQVPVVEESGYVVQARESRRSADPAVEAASKMYLAQQQATGKMMDAVFEQMLGLGGLVDRVVAQFDDLAAQRHVQVATPAGVVVGLQGYSGKWDKNAHTMAKLHHRRMDLQTFVSWKRQVERWARSNHGAMDNLTPVEVEDSAPLYLDAALVGGTCV